MLIFQGVVYPNDSKKNSSVVLPDQNKWRNPLPSPHATSGIPLMSDCKISRVSFFQRCPEEVGDARGRIISMVKTVENLRVLRKPVVLLTEEILHQLIGSLSHYLQGLYMSGGAGFLPSTVSSCDLVLSEKKRHHLPGGFCKGLWMKKQNSIAFT